MSYTTSLSDTKYKKLESQQQSRLYPERGLESNDCTDIFSLPQYIRVMVSNYQPLQTVFAIDKGECQSEGLKTDEQFSPTVTIADTTTQQTLDCVLLLHGEKPPKVNYRTLFCYIAVQVSYCDACGSHPYPLYHVESKPCKQDKLLTFCFHQPGTVCVIHLSVHSIVDSEGVEYMYHSEDCTCVVQIIDRDQHGGVRMRDRHGVVRIKESPLLTYSGPLATKQYHKIETQFTEMFRAAKHEDMQKLSKLVACKSSSSLDIKVFALCWEALSEAVQLRNYEHAEKCLRTAWEKATKLDCENSLLLQGRTLRHLAYLRYTEGRYDEALDYMSKAKTILVYAAPSEETAHALYTELLVEKWKLFTIPNPAFSSQLLSFEEKCELLLEHAKCMKDYEKGSHCSYFTMKASFHLRSDLITDKLPPDEYRLSPDDLVKAEDCLKNVALKIMCQSDQYKARYYCTVCDLHIWKQDYHNAKYYLEEASKLSQLPCINQRLQLIERLKGDDNSD